MSVNIINKESSDFLKWICSITVLVGHILLYSNDIRLSEVILIPPFDYFIGTICVGVFLFLSGYGLSYSLVNKEGYLNNFSKRIKSIIIPFIFIVIIYHCVYILTNYIGLLNNLHEIEQTLTDRILPFSWYIFLQTILYLFFYISFKFFKRHYYGIVLLTLFCITLIMLMRIFEYPSYSIVSIPCYLLGVYCGFYTRKTNYFSILSILLFLLLGLNILLHINIPLLNYTLISFIIVIIFGKLFKGKFKLFQWLKNVDSYFIYLVQGFWIVLPNYDNLFTYILCSFIGSMITAFILNYTYKIIFSSRKV